MLWSKPGEQFVSASHIPVRRLATVYSRISPAGSGQNVSGIQTWPVQRRNLLLAGLNTTRF